MRQGCKIRGTEYLRQCMRVVNILLQSAENVELARNSRKEDQPQQVELSEQPRHGSVPLRAPMMTPVAHPTPAFTDRASAGQFIAHAPHSMQASRSTILAFPFSTTKTPWGQTSSHMPQPVHFSASNSRVTTFRRYRNFKIASSFLMHRDEGRHAGVSCPSVSELHSHCGEISFQTNLPASHSPRPTTAVIA